ncbi:hypothetical protein LCGC14_2461620, partial [marine sediment metagenome]
MNNPKCRIESFQNTSGNFLAIPGSDLILYKRYAGTVYCFTHAEVLKILAAKTPTIPGTKIKLPKNFMRAFKAYYHKAWPPSSQKAQMPKALAERHRRITEKYFNDRRYHRQVNGLPESIQDALKAYTQTPSYKYKRVYYAQIKTGISQMPKSTEELVVFRGQGTDEINPKYWFSASTEQEISLEKFTAVHCCLFVLYVQPGVKLLPVYKFERNFNKLENEVIVEGGGYLQFVDQDFTGAMPIYTYRYSMEPFPEKSPKPKKRKPPSPPSGK